MNVHIPTRPPDHLDVPASLGRLVDLSYNLWWTWNRPARQLFERVDADLWTRYRNPVRLLLHSRTSHLLRLADDAGFMDQLSDVVADFDAHMARPSMDDGAPIAYVSAEYGLTESLPIYSGGLGVLSADHLKEASDMAMPMVAIGLFYRRGYFRQMLDADGRQQHHYAELDALRLPLLRVRDAEGRTLRVPVELPGRTVFLRVWVTSVGRVPLLLLDSYTSRNAPEDRYITSQLYVSGRAMRLEQEIVFGRGAIEVLSQLGIRPRMYHMNEGHSAFLALENARRTGRPDLGSALDAVRTQHVFTTHTPVPAGNEVFDETAVRPYLEDTARDLHTSTDELIALGRADESSGFEPGFNLTALALRLSRKANGVSQLHGEVSRQMWPGFDIDAVTNGVHAATWVGREVALVLGMHEGSDPHALAAGAANLSDETLWAAHTAQKHRLMRFVRVRALRQAARHGRSTAEMRRIHGLLNPNALTLGFARRFAPYKRADMLFHDVARIERLLCNEEHPVQLIMAGKAHPADKAGQQIIERVWTLANSEQLSGRVVFVEDYDTAVARLMVRGVDVWLNTPEYPREASGTSGMKAAMNGVLHASVPDGWWAEADRDEVGFTIGQTELPDLQRDSEALYKLLEERIVPLYFERVDGLPRAWISVMRRSIELCLGRFSTRRMLTDYAERLYGMSPTPVA